MELLWAFILVAICSFALGIVITSCIVYRVELIKERKSSLPSSYEVSMEQIEQWVRNELDDKRPFDQQIFEWLNSSENKANMIKAASPTVECITDCEGTDCPCSPAREDCCDSFTNGKCKVTININKLCGIEEYERDPSLLTTKEAETLANVLASFISSQDKK